MAPEAHRMDILPPPHLPYDVLDFMQTTDLVLDDIETLEFDFDAGFPSFFEGLETAETRQQTDQNDGPEIGQDAEETASRREAFERSPWFWKPSSAQNAFSDHPRMPLESDNVDVAASPHWPYSVDLIIQDKLSQQTRDRILQLVIQTVGSKVSIPSFPSAKFLDILIKNGIAKKLETDAWIHPHTHVSQTTRAELLTALIAAGCVCFGIMAVGKTGGLLQEIVRVALSNLVEKDNSVLRDLQYLQAYMIWIDIGIWCGYKRQMEIAESNLQPLCTALRKAGAFNKSFYKRIIPSPDDDDATLEQKWRQWVEQESYKRLVYHLFEHDILVAFTMTRNPLTSYSEFSVPFPAERDIWLAPSPSAWRAIHLSKVRAPDPVFNSLRDILIKPDRLNTLSGDADFDRATSIFVHGVGAMVWDYRKQASITQESSSHDDPTAHLWLQSRRQELSTLLQTLQTTHPRAPAVLTLLAEFLQMHLHASLDDMQRFAGKYGEAEARRACASMLVNNNNNDPNSSNSDFSSSSWPTTRASRTAVWHAGQVLRAARSVPPYQLRGADAIAVYYAALTLWVWAVLRERMTASAGAVTTTMTDGTGGGRGGGVVHSMHTDLVVGGSAGAAGAADSVGAHGTVPVRLDGAKGREQEAFLAHGVGTPVLGFDWHRERAGEEEEADGRTRRLRRRQQQQQQQQEQEQEEGGSSSRDGRGGFVEIQPSQVMRVGAQVLEGNYPNSGKDELPPMIMSLRNLMRDLGRSP
ncbi:hypothetical protein BFW01_g9774 [Lasiodiplodia theobromae]|nr:hypothetical protein BFW01_g9774 [Lasiodiplodia theobromae]